MGEMFITAEKVGAGRDFFVALAHDEKLFWNVLEASGVRPVFNVKVYYNVDNDAQVRERIYYKSGQPGGKITDISKITTSVTDRLVKKRLQLEVEMALFWFDRKIYSDQVIEEMKTEKWRPAATVELDAFQRQFPDIQKRIPVVGLGTIIKPDDSSGLVPFLDWSDDPEVNRIFKLTHQTPKWDAFIRFLAVREEAV